MKTLKELNARFVGAGGEGVFNADGSPAPQRTGVGVALDCPCGKCDEYHWLFVPFTNPIDGGPAVEHLGRPTWQRTGDTIETLTLSPSILRSIEKGGCGWHGYIENGQVRTC